jgi:flavin-dependent dehydrogenase
LPEGQQGEKHVVLSLKARGRVREQSGKKRKKRKSACRAAQREICRLPKRQIEMGTQGV